MLVWSEGGLDVRGAGRPPLSLPSLRRTLLKIPAHQLKSLELYIRKMLSQTLVFFYFIFYLKPL